MEIALGDVVAKRYRIVRPLGRGGMGEVFAAENLRTGRLVAVKLLRSDTKEKAVSVARFRQEARAAGAIHSDHVTQVLDVEEDDAVGVVLVFELLEGESLIERLQRTGPIAFDELFPLVEQIWMGLAAAHRVGVIHRDLKPSNVFLEQRLDGSSRVKILDFGISKVPKEMGGETLTEVGQNLGTFSFMPPEQIGLAKTVDHRADIYACTTLIYQSLSGLLPYNERNIVALIEQKRSRDPATLATAMEEPVDPRLEAFIAAGLARDPDRRFQTALDALAAWRALKEPATEQEPRTAVDPLERTVQAPPRSPPDLPAPAPATGFADPQRDSGPGHTEIMPHARAPKAAPPPFPSPPPPPPPPPPSASRVASLPRPFAAVENDETDDQTQIYQPPPKPAFALAPPSPPSGAGARPDPRRTAPTLLSTRVSPAPRRAPPEGRELPLIVGAVALLAIAIVVAAAVFAYASAHRH